MSSAASTDVETRCPSCGQEVPAGWNHCPNCAQAIAPRGIRLALTVLLVLIVLGLALTRYFVNLHRTTEADLAERWFARGNVAMQAGNPAAAAEDFRTALSYDRDNQQYRLRLSEALLESHHLNEARAYLTSLWEAVPAGGEVNLQLARLYARRKSPAEAVRYYHDAINGTWAGDAFDKRVAARFELVNYLLQLNDQGKAAAELIALQADEPNSVPDQLRLADLLLKVNEPAHARDVYKRVLEDDHENPTALLGWGRASLEFGDYREAEQALASAVEHDPASQEARSQLELAREILRISPALRGLSMTERARRAAEAFTTAFERLTSCSGTLAEQPAAPDDLQLLYSSGVEKQTSATERALEKNPDALEPTMQYVFQVENATASRCSEMSETDRALLFLAQHQRESTQ